MLIQASATDVVPEESELTPEELTDQPPPERGRRARTIALGIAVLLVVLVLFLALTAPLSKSLKPITAPSVTLLSAEGKPIARKGSVTDLPVQVGRLPAHVPQAFLAIEDRRFYEHLGVDPWGIARAGARNLVSGGVVEGGSTISQQLAKLAFLSSDQTAARKIQEAILALWLETWLSKDEILSRYMSSVYFGDNVYGLRAAANHYFSRRPEELTVEQAAMLAGLVKAPSKLAPTSNLEGARKRGRLVVSEMVEAGFLDQATARKLPVVALDRGPVKDVPNGTYFADWVFKELGQSEPRYGEQRIQTTLEDRLQRQAARAIRGAGIGGAQVALVSMRTDGRVVAMVGGRSYRQSPYNRVTQAKRQSGSTFKLFVYLAAMRAGFSPNDMIEDRPVRIGNWTPENYEGKYRGVLPLRDAFAFSSNVAAVRLSQRVGRERVIRAARDLGVTSELEQGPTIALGTSALSLMEMTSAFAAVAKGSYPVKPSGLPDGADGGGTPFEGGVRENMMQLLGAVTDHGTGRAAKLPFQTFGKTGTTQGNRDAYFIGFAGDIVTGVWIGRDDNQPVGNVQGGGVPAVIWRNFMSEAVKAAPATAAVPAEADVAEGETLPAAPYGTVTPQQDYYVGDYDVEDGGDAPQSSPGNDGGAPLSDFEEEEEEEAGFESGPVEIAPPAAPEAGPGPRDNAPRGRREPPTLAAPPSPPEPEEEEETLVEEEEIVEG